MPGVGAGLVRAGGGDVVVVVAGAVDGVDGVCQDLGGRVGAGGVGADPVGVDRRDLGRDTDAVQGDSGRPGVAGDLGGEVAGEVGAVGVVAGESDGQVLAVVQPHVAGVAGADGDQQGVGRGLVGDHLAEVCRVGVRREGSTGFGCLGRSRGRGGPRRSCRWRVRWWRPISTAATAGIGRLAAAWWLASARSARSTRSTVSSVADPTVARVFSTGARTGGAVAIVRPGRRWRICAARRRRSSIHRDPASTGPPASPASSHGAGSAPSAGAAVVEGLPAASFGWAVPGVFAACGGAVVAGVLVGRWGGRWTGVGGLGSGDCGVGCRARRGPRAAAEPPALARQRR